MNFIFLGLSLLLCYTGLCRAQPNVVRASRIALPPGKVVGVAIDADAGRLLIQQSRYEVSDSGMKGYRFISLWNLSDNTKIGEKRLGFYSANPPRPQCGNIELDSKFHRILVCAENSVSILDEKLDLIHSITLDQDTHVDSITMDQERDRLFIISSQTNASYPSSYMGQILIHSYSLTNGDQQGKAEVGVLGLVDDVSSTLDAVSGTVAVALIRRGQSPWRTDVFSCSQGIRLSCDHSANLPPVSQIKFLDGNLLAAVDGEHGPKSCIISVTPTTHGVARGYCPNKFAVHSGLGISENKYIATFTGTQKHTHFLSEGYRNVQDSVTLWCASSPQKPIVVPYFVAHGVLQRTVRLEGSKTSSYVVAYSELEPQYATEIGVYKLSGCE